MTEDVIDFINSKYSFVPTLKPKNKDTKNPLLFKEDKPKKADTISFEIEQMLGLGYDKPKINRVLRLCKKVKSLKKLLKSTFPNIDKLYVFTRSKYIISSKKLKNIVVINENISTCKYKNRDVVIVTINNKKKYISLPDTFKDKLDVSIYQSFINEMGDMNAILQRKYLEFSNSYLGKTSGIEMFDFESDIFKIENFILDNENKVPADVQKGFKNFYENQELLSGTWKNVPVIIINNKKPPKKWLTYTMYGNRTLIESNKKEVKSSVVFEKVTNHTEKMFPKKETFENVFGVLKSSENGLENDKVKIIFHKEKGKLCGKTQIFGKNDFQHIIVKPITIPTVWDDEHIGDALCPKKRGSVNYRKNADAQRENSNKQQQKRKMLMIAYCFDKSTPLGKIKPEQCLSILTK